MFNEISTQVFYLLHILLYLNFYISIIIQNTYIDDKTTPIHLAFYLRFFFIFRNYIPKEDISNIIKFISYFMASK